MKLIMENWRKYTINEAFFPSAISKEPTNIFSKWVQKYKQSTLGKKFIDLINKDPDAYYFTHSIGTGSQRKRIKKFGGVPSIIKGIKEHGILFHVHPNGGIRPFLFELGQGKQAVDNFFKALMSSGSAKWLQDAPAIIIVKLPKSGNEGIMAGAKSLDEPGVEGAKEMAAKLMDKGAVKGASKGVHGPNHVIPKEHVVAAIINGKFTYI